MTHLKCKMRISMKSKTQAARGGKEDEGEGRGEQRGEERGGRSGL